VVPPVWGSLETRVSVPDTFPMRPRAIPNRAYGGSLHVSREHFLGTGTAERERTPGTGTKPMKRARNELKRIALTVFEDRGWLNVPAWAKLAGYYPIRGAYAVLKRYHRWKLLDRRLDARGLILYRISDRGRARLAWLRGQTK
jgi:hypothetical protein